MRIMCKKDERIVMPNFAMCNQDEGIVMPNFAALRVAVFPISTKNFGGGGGYPPPVGARVKTKAVYKVKTFE